MKYFSEKTKQMYEDVPALEEAEKKFDEEHAAELAKKEERAAKAKAVEELYKEANDAYKKANEALNEFIKEYGSFHRTYTTTLPDTKSLVDAMFNSFWF